MLTSRGETVVLTLVLAVIGILLFGCFTLGQHLKHNRLTESGLIPPLTCEQNQECQP